MSHPLQAHVRSLRRALRRSSIFAAVFRGLAIVLVTVVAVACVDFFVRFEDRGLRVIASMVVAGVTVAMVLRALRVQRRRRLSDVDVAQCVERQFPALSDRLSSAMAFLDEDEHDPLAGSAQLRRAVVLHSATETEGLRWEAVIDRRPVRRAVLLLAAAACVAAAPLLLAPQASRTALQRIVHPLSNIAWPRAHHLVLKDAPQRIASGQDFEVELLDRAGPLPDRVWIHYRRQRAGQWQEEQQPMQLVGEVMVARKETVTAPFEYRASGGDDDTMPWRRLEVIEPPRIRSLQITLHPPAYTGYPPYSSQRHIRALVGTQIGVQGEASETLRSARLVFQKGDPIAAKLDTSGRNFEVFSSMWEARESTTYSWELTDQDGLAISDPDKLTLHVQEDPPPTINFEEPSQDLFVTPQAAILIRVLAKDNLAIRDVRLAYWRSDQSETDEHSVLLYERPQDFEVQLEGESPLRAEGERRQIEYEWQLGSLGLSPGSHLLVNAHATDFRPGAGQTVVPRRINIITAAELEDRLAQRQDAILAQLESALRAQRDAREETSAVRIKTQTTGALSEQGQDQLRAIELNQRHVAALVVDQHDGAIAQVDSVLEDLQRNRVDNPEFYRRMNGLRDELLRLGRAPLPAIQRELTAALKGAQADAGNADAVVAPLSQGVLQQDRVIEALETLVDDLSQWADYRRFARDIAQLRADQQQLQQATRDDIGLQALNVDPQDLKPSQQANLRAAASRQLSLARRLDAVQQRMQQTIEELSQRDPVAAQTLADALDQARRLGVSGKMRAASRNVEQNQIGQAISRQTEVAEDLRDLVDTLRNRREHELSRLVSKLREAEQELAQLRQQVEGLRKQVEAAEDAPGQAEQRRRLQRLTKNRDQLQEQVARMGRTLKRLTADRAGRSADRAADQLAGSAGQQPGQQVGDPPQTGKLSGDNVRRAQRDLEQAQQQLADARRQAEADLARERLAQFETAIRSLVDGQSRVLDETTRLESLRDEEGQLSFAQLSSLSRLAGQQMLLRDETQQHGEGMRGLGVFRLALERTTDDMSRAATMLERRRTDEPTQQLERSALQRLEQLLSVLVPDDEPANEQGNQGGAGGGGQGQGDQPQPTLNLAELKLLRLMQLDLQQQTLRWEQRARQPHDADLAADAQRLAEEQASLAQLVIKSIDEAAGEEQLDDGLPDLEKALLQEQDLPTLEDELPPLELQP